MAFATIILLISRNRRLAGVAGAVSVFGVIGLAPALPAWTSPTAGAPSVTLVQFNLSFSNRAPAAVAEFIRAEDADIVTLQEVTRKTGRVMAILKKEYPNVIRCPFSGVGGVAVLSRLPKAAGVSEGCVIGQGLAWLRILVDGQPVSVASVHLHWPYPYGQAGHIDRLQPYLQDIPRPVLLGGDFNAAPWSHAVSRIESATGSNLAGGLRFTFYKRGTPWGPAIGLPIDHILLPPGIRSADISTGPGVGSDHLPIVARLLLQ